MPSRRKSSQQPVVLQYIKLPCLLGVCLTRVALTCALACHDAVAKRQEGTALLVIHAAVTPVLIRRPCVHCQADRLQQYRDKVAQQSAAVSPAASLHAHSNLEQLVDHISQEEHAQHDTQARFVILPAGAAT